MNKNDNLNTLFSEIKDETKSYFDVKVRLFQLIAYEKGSRISSFILFGVILVLVVFFAVLFLFLALGFYLGEVLHSVGLGMAIVAILYFLVLLVLFLHRNRIQLWITNLVLAEMLKEEDEKNEEK